MSLSLYEVAVPTFARGLATFEHILTKAEEFAREKGLDANATFTQARLIADQLPLAFQVQNAAKAVKIHVGNLTGTPFDPAAEPQKNVADLTLVDLHAILRDTQALLKTVQPDVVRANSDKEIVLIAAGQKYNLTVQDALIRQGIPNFIFHLSTGYSILRAKGVPVGKADFITSFVTV